MALYPKALVTRALLKETLGSRGARLETDGLVGSAPDVEVGGFIGLLKLYKDWIPKLRHRDRIIQYNV